MKYFQCYIVMTHVITGSFLLFALITSLICTKMAETRTYDHNKLETFYNWNSFSRVFIYLTFK
jgi:hypothetical protein